MLVYSGVLWTGKCLEVPVRNLMLSNTSMQQGVCVALFQLAFHGDLPQWHRDTLWLQVVEHDLHQGWSIASNDRRWTSNEYPQGKHIFPSCYTLR